jgi:pimeloyl-ACP methyl ester carboxylesterase
MYPVRPLRRRVFLGLRVRARGPGEVEVAAVLEGGAGSVADVRDGDTLLSVAGRPVRDALGLVELSRALAPGDEISFRVRRGDGTLEVQAPAPELPLEQVAGANVLLGQVMVGGHALRTIEVVPRTAGPHPAVLFLQDVRPYSCEFPFDPEHPVPRLVEAWAAAGFMVVRVERSGVGDSGGPPPASTDLGMELDTYDAALDALLADARVDASRVFLAAYSFGAAVAPMVALDRRLGGVLVLAGTAARWHDAVVASGEARLGALGGPADVRAKVAAWSELHGLVCRERQMPERVFATRPDLLPLRSADCTGETLFGRHAALFQQLDTLDLRAAWRDVGRDGTRVLAIGGEYDWVCGRRAAADIASAVAESTGRSLEVERLGHDLLTHTSLADSAARPSEGRWDGRLLPACAELFRP